MTSYVVYEDRNATHKTAGKFPRSAPIAADNAKARAVLERAGWHVAEKYDAETSPENTVDADDTTEVAPVAGFAWADAGLKPEQWEALNAAGYGSEDALNAATDAQLGDVKGVGEASIRNLRKFLKSPAE